MTDLGDQAELATISPAQWKFVSWLIAILADIVVLNLFVEYVHSLVIDSFTITILTAIVLRAMVQVTLRIEHAVSARFSTRPGRASSVLRVSLMWLILFGSKFIILELIDVIFGDHVELHGLVLIIALIAAMIVVEQAMIRIYARLSTMPQREQPSTAA